jgi:hypothetical protein
MPYMQEIKTTVGQNDPFATGAPPSNLLCQFGRRENFLCGPRQSVLHDGAQ